MAKLHFVTGKGGVGKSSLAAALVKQLVAAKRGPVLLIDVQGSGRGLQWLGLEGAPFEIRPLGIPGGFGCRILPKETFRQYFGKLLALGNETGTLASVTAGLRERVADKVTSNRIVSAFIDVCPGLEPSVLLGKIHWEAAYGKTPGGEEPWSDVVVDAPATGHGLALFESTAALIEVFGAGLIFRQATEVMDFVRDSTRTSIWVATLPEEVPVRETLELIESLRKRRLEPSGVLVNRHRPRTPHACPSNGAESPWREEIEFEIERSNEQARLETELGDRTQLPLVRFPDVASFEAPRIVEDLKAVWLKAGVQ